MDFQQSQTYQNLLKAFHEELTSTSEFLLNADQARFEGYIQIGNVYDIAARNEREHARIYQRFLNGGVLPRTEQNLLDSANRSADAASLYRDYARVAREEGYTDLAAIFNGIANIELNHEASFRSEYGDIVRDEVFCKPEETLWICMVCGNIMSGKCAPTVCPICGYPQGYYRLYTNVI